MPFILPKDCLKYYQNIFDSKSKNGQKLKYKFDEYYFCLLAGLACAKYNKDAELDPNSQIDEYPSEYQKCKDYIAGLLIATEVKRRGIVTEDAFALESLMVEYIDSTSRTRLNRAGEMRLNQYASRGFELIQSKMGGKPYRLEMFLLDYLDCFQKGLFTKD